MSIYIEHEYAGEILPDYEALASKVIEFTLDYMKCPYEAEVNLVLTSNTEIAKMNKQFRNIDKETDVLSFPMQEFPAPGDFSGLEEEGSGEFHPESGELLLGDMILSMDKVISQAEEFGHSQEREFAFLIVHSMLHLIGYDHMDPAEAEEMEGLQRQILDKLNISR